jgi:hypothetical protein
LLRLTQQVPPTIHEEDAAVPEVRRSFSEPSVAGRRGALELSRESLDDKFVHRGSAMDGAWRCPCARQSTRNVCYTLSDVACASTASCLQSAAEVELYVREGVALA